MKSAVSRIGGAYYGPQGNRVAKYDRENAARYKRLKEELIVNAKVDKGAISKFVMAQFATEQRLTTDEIKLRCHKQFGRTSSSYTSIISILVLKWKRLRRYTLNGQVWLMIVTRPPLALPEGALDLGFKHMRKTTPFIDQSSGIVRRPKVASEQVAGLLTLQYGQNESITVDKNSARQLYDQLTGWFT